MSKMAQIVGVQLIMFSNNNTPGADLTAMVTPRRRLELFNQTKRRVKKQRQKSVRSSVWPSILFCNNETPISHLLHETTLHLLVFCDPICGTMRTIPVSIPGRWCRTIHQNTRHQNNPHMDSYNTHTHTLTIHIHAIHMGTYGGPSLSERFYAEYIR